MERADMNPAAVFLILEGPQVLRSAGSEGVFAARAPRLTHEALWLLLEGTYVPAAPPVDRAA